MRAYLFAAVLLWALPAALPAMLSYQDAVTAPAPPRPPTSSVGDVAAATVVDQAIVFDSSDRMTLPVFIGDQGPFAFVVDSGAERSVIARELAERLSLERTGQARVIGLADIVMADLYRIDYFSMQDVRSRARLVPAFDYRHIGAAGLIGIDELDGHAVVLDFRRSRITIRPSAVRRRSARETGFDSDTIVVSARRTAGRLIFSDASVGGRRVDVVVDTGAQGSLGNRALQRLVRASRLQRGRLRDAEITSITGATMNVDQTNIERLTIGGFDFTNLPVAYADSPAFALLDLEQRPALLLGMDALTLFERVAIDFTNRRVSFDLPDGAFLRERTQLAMR